MTQPPLSSPAAPDLAADRWVLRAAEADDLDALERMARASATGITTLPPDRSALQARLQRSCASFASPEQASGGCSAPPMTDYLSVHCSDLHKFVALPAHKDYHQGWEFRNLISRNYGHGLCCRKKPHIHPNPPPAAALVPPNHQFANPCACIADANP